MTLLYKNILVSIFLERVKTGASLCVCVCVWERERTRKWERERDRIIEMKLNRGVLHWHLLEPCWYSIFRALLLCFLDEKFLTGGIGHRHLILPAAHWLQLLWLTKCYFETDHKSVGTCVYIISKCLPFLPVVSSRDLLRPMYCLFPVISLITLMHPV